MQRPETAEVDRTVGVSPAPRPEVPWRVVSVEPLAGATLRVTFHDGTAGEVRLHDFLASPLVTGSVFEALSDSETFRQVRVELGVVTWPNGADLAPDAMYDAILQHGYWLVEA